MDNFQEFEIYLKTVFFKTCFVWGKKGTLKTHLGIYPLSNGYMLQRGQAKSLQPIVKQGNTLILYYCLGDNTIEDQQEPNE